MKLVGVNLESHLQPSAHPLMIDSLICLYFQKQPAEEYHLQCWNKLVYPGILFRIWNMFSYRNS